jgi:hypothetical protein
MVSPVFDWNVLDFANRLEVFVLPFCFFTIFSHPPHKIHGGIAGQFIFPNSIVTSEQKSSCNTSHDERIQTLLAAHYDRAWRHRQNRQDVQQAHIYK